MRPLDDILILGTSQPECLNNTRQAISLLRRLGFILYEDKSQLSPSEQILFLGPHSGFGSDVSFLGSSERPK